MWSALKEPLDVVTATEEEGGERGRVVKLGGQFISRHFYLCSMRVIMVTQLAKMKPTLPIIRVRRSEAERKITENTSIILL